MKCHCEGESPKQSLLRRAGIASPAGKRGRNDIFRENAYRARVNGSSQLGISFDFSLGHT